MHFELITLFPEQFDSFFSTSIIGRAAKKGCFTENRIQLRKHGLNKYGQVDDDAYGGEAGMVMRPEPATAAIREAVANCSDKKAKVIYFTPQGRPLNQDIVKEYACGDTNALVLFCGHYKGLDERVCETIIDDEISIGDYILTGGELPAMIFMDAVIRFQDEALGNFASATGDSFTSRFLEHPLYTRPEVFEGMAVPEVLISGHHKRIEEWRLEMRLRRTLKRRPDLIEKEVLTKEEKKILNKIKGETK
ncbi:MAG: tRNA (guanosine(37)-N1)-methyltransferase TrmD [Fibrobacteres bacterium]|nr:tRNA (guanosine(37)-N1)-methyltransferase TrmD [Fibrobacterota bacterium]